MKDKKFFLGAVILAAGGFIGKAIGALYRIPLMNVLGAEGMGVYQLIFPLYSLLLTFSSSAVPVAISRLVAENVAAGNTANAKRVFHVSAVLFLAIGCIAGILLYLLSSWIGRVQGNGAAGLGYRYIAPAIVLVSVISAFRGYFQGLQQMAPTALSQIVEQIVKLGLGLYLAAKFMPDIALAVGGAILAVTASEAVALIILFVQYLAGKRKRKTTGTAEKSFFAVAKHILKITLPVTLGALILPFSQIVDSLMVINLISRYADNATELYGLMTGAVFSLNSLPVAVAFSVAVSSVPLIAKTKLTDSRQLGKKISASVGLTMMVAVPAALVIACFSHEIAQILYGGLGGDTVSLLAGLFRAASVSVIFLSFTQTLTSCLQGLGKIYVPVINLAVGVAVKVALGYFLLKVPSLNIYGAVISTNACYLVAGILNLVYIIKAVSFRLRFSKTVLLPAALSLAAVGIIFLLLRVLELRLGVFTSFLLAFSGGAAAYLGLLSLFYHKRREKR